MLSKKYFLAGELDFSTPLVRPARANVTDHIESQESDHRASYMSYRGLQQRRQLKTDFREILGAAQFSTSSTASITWRSSPRATRTGCGIGKWATRS
jgi:hypothetical protein